MRHDHPVFLFVAGLALCLLFYLWATLLMATEGPSLPCGEVGTDGYYECLTGEEIDLTPMIQDEAQTLTSQRREP